MIRATVMLVTTLCCLLCAGENSDVRCEIDKLETVRFFRCEESVINISNLSPI